MRKRYFLVPILFLMLFFVSRQGSSQLIDYSKRDKKASVLVPMKPAAFDSSSGTKSSAQVIETSLAAEIEDGDAPRARNRREQRYDLNRDGKMQEAEIKAFLKDVITRVETYGEFSFTSGLLRPYDLEGDSVIRLYELDRIRNRVAEE